MSEKKLVLQRSISGHSGAIYDVICDQEYLYTTSADKFIVRWKSIDGTQDDFTVKVEYTAFNVAYSPVNGLLIIGNSKGGLHCVDTTTKQEKKYLTQHKSPIFALTYDPVNHVFYSGDKDGYFCAWEAETMKLLITLPLDCGKIRQIKLSNDGEHLAICGQDGWLRIFETGFFNEIKALNVNTNGVNCCLFLPDDRVMVGGKDAHLTVFNWKTGEKVQSIPAHNYAIYDLRLIGKGDYIVSVSFDKTIKLWSWPELRILQRIEFKDEGHRHTVNRIAQLDEHKIATVSDDAKIKIWKLEC